jgi:hypothetical protein
LPDKHLSIHLIKLEIPTPAILPPRENPPGKKITEKSHSGPLLILITDRSVITPQTRPVG